MAPVYAAALALAAARPGLFASSRFFSLDELGGLAPDHPASFAHFLRTRFLGPAGAAPARIRLPRGDAADATPYEADIAAAGGIGLQVLGIGRNGHIAFNEPGSDAGTRTRFVRLAPETRQALAAAFPPGEVPPAHGLTMGVRTILESRRILLVALGESKAPAVAAALNDTVGPACPASFLRRHRDAFLLCDEAAASRL